MDRAFEAEQAANGLVVANLMVLGQFDYLAQFYRGVAHFGLAGLAAERFLAVPVPAALRPPRGGAMATRCPAHCDVTPQNHYLIVYRRYTICHVARALRPSHGAPLPYKLPLRLRRHTTFSLEGAWMLTGLGC